MAPINRDKFCKSLSRRKNCGLDYGEVNDDAAQQQQQPLEVQQEKVKPKVYRKGRITRNSFLNFLREFRPNHSNRSITDLAKDAAAIWRNMSAHDKQRYKEQASLAPRVSYKKRRMCRYCHKKFRNTKGRSGAKKRLLGYRCGRLYFS